MGAHLNTAVRDTLTLPFRGNALAVNVTFGLLLGLLLAWMTRAGFLALFGLPALVILLPWFLKYCLVVAQAAADGAREPPRMSLAHLNPLEVQPLVLTLALLAVHEGLAWTLGPLAAVAGIALLAPAAMAVLVLEERALDALDPRVLARCVRGLGPGYPLAVAVLGAGLALGVLAMGSGPGVALTVFLLQSVLLATFYGFGRVLHARGDVLDNDFVEPVEEGPEADREREVRAIEDQLHKSFRLAEADRAQEAVDGLLACARAHDERPAVFEALLRRALAWPDATVGPAFARHYVERLRRLGRHGDALEVFLRAFDRQPLMRPMGEAATLRLARDARDRGRIDAALALYGDFEARFPGSSQIPVALVEQAFLLFRERAQASEAAALLDRVAREYPAVTEREDVQRLRARVGGAGESG